jgi:branched-chain amino acid transport system permease protein
MVFLWLGAAEASSFGINVSFQVLFMVIIGGAGSLLGSFVGSILVGFIYNFGQALLPELAYFVLFMPMLLVLLLRPQGLFGRHVL